MRARAPSGLPSHEKRAATREKALAGLVQYLRASYRYEECDSWKETLAERLAACVKKGKAKEVTLACTAAALMVATLGQSSDGFTEQLVEEFLPLLKLKVRSHHHTTEKPQHSLRFPTQTGRMVD